MRVEQSNLYCETCGFPYPGGRATQAFLRGFDGGECRRHAEAVQMHEAISRHVPFHPADALEEERRQMVDSLVRAVMRNAGGQ